MRKRLLRSLPLLAVLAALMIPTKVSAKTANASATPTVSGASYSTTVKIHLQDIPDDGSAKASEAAKFTSGYVSISSTGYSDYLRVKFTLQNSKNTTVDSVVATITKSGTATPVPLDLYDTSSAGLLTYRSKIDGTVTQIDINLKHVCAYDTAQIPDTTTAATCTEDGTRTKTCIYCNGTKTELTAKATGHAFTKKVYDEKYLHTEATCTKDRTYFYSCCYCGEKGTETFAETGTAVGHQWGEYVVTKPATCTADGTQTATCDICKTATDTVPDAGSAKGHTWDEGVVTTAPTVDSEGVKTFTCLDCQATKTESIPKSEPENPDPGTNDPTVPKDPSNDHTKPAAGDQTQTPAAKPAASKTLTAKAHAPKTGDTGTQMLWIALLLLSAISFTGVGRAKRSR